MRGTDITGIVQVAHHRQASIFPCLNSASCVSHQRRGCDVDVMASIHVAIHQVIDIVGVNVDVIVTGDRTAVSKIGQLQIHLISVDCTAVIKYAAIHLQIQITVGGNRTTVLGWATVAAPTIGTDG